MSENLDDDGLVTRFAGGRARGICYQINGRIPDGSGALRRNETQLTGDEARKAARVILLDLAARSEFDRVDIRDLALLLRRAEGQGVQP